MPSTVKTAFRDGKRLLSFDGGEFTAADAQNMKTARQVVQAVVPVPLGLQPSFGFGDRTGLATPGHVAALMSASTPIRPIFAQQSIREMARTNRTPQEVMDEAIFGVLQSSYRGQSGADADHLKTTEDVDRMAAAGFTFFTIDPSDFVDGGADGYSVDQLQEKVAAVREEVAWLDQYQGNSIKLDRSTTMELSEEACLRAAVKYGRAINHAVAMSGHIDRTMSQIGPYEIELSVDETAQPTTLAEHYIIAHQCLSRGVKMISLAPRYIGDFEKGVDYKGDVKLFEQSLREHAAIAKLLGPYKLSLHSGSDKLSIYGSFARLSGGKFHVKTAGTSYLESLRVVCRHDLKLFRELIDFSRSRYDTDKATYHVSATLDMVPGPKEISDPRQLEKAYLGLWSDARPSTGLSDPGRQVMHCTFGSVLTHKKHSRALRDVLVAHPDTYVEILADHFGRHLEALARGMD